MTRCNAPHNSTIARQAIIATTNLSCHLVGTLTSQWWPLQTILCISHNAPWFRSLWWLPASCGNKQSVQLVTEFTEKLQKWEEENLFFFFLTFQTTKILFWVYQNGNFLPGKSIQAFHAEKKSGKITLPPQKNLPVMPLGTKWCGGRGGGGGFSFYEYAQTVQSTIRGQKLTFSRKSVLFPLQNYIYIYYSNHVFWYQHQIIKGISLLL